MAAIQFLPLLLPSSTGCETDDNETKMFGSKNFDMIEPMKYIIVASRGRLSVHCVAGLGELP